MISHRNYKATTFFFYLYAIIFLFFPSLIHAACNITDDINTKIYLPNSAKRIISLAPDITETLFAIGAGDRVVGVVSGSDYPLGAQTLPQVGSYSGIDLEKIISLHPDLIVTWSRTFSRQLVVLKKWGIPIYITEPRRLEDVPRTMRNLGCLAGTERIANQAAENFTQRLTHIHKQYHAEKAITVFYQIGSYSLITINQDSWINQVITLCGGRNIFANSHAIAPEVGWEAVVSANPEVVISGTTHHHWKDRWQRWPEIAAVKNQQLYAIHPDLIERAGPRLLVGAMQICEQLQTARGHLTALKRS